MKQQKKLYIASVFLVLFIFWTILIQFVDVKAIGPQASYVGFATINGYFHSLTGVHMSLYVITDWLSVIPLAFVVGFALLGFVQWIKRKSILKVDYSLFVLGGFYLVVMVSYVLFEMLVINYRPILINGQLEASYPSSTTMLVMCVMPVTIMQFNDRIKNEAVRRCVACVLSVFIIFMVLGRLLSGVHWLTDIVGGALISVGLVMLYDYCVKLKL